MVRHTTLNRIVVGSNPTSAGSLKRESLADERKRTRYKGMLLLGYDRNKAGNTADMKNLS